MMNYLWPVLCFALLISFIASDLQAQTTNATINGQITDPQSRAVPGVEVQAVNIDTNVVYPSQTNSVGIYAIPSILPGRYRIMVRKDGFKVINKTDIVLNVQDILEQNFTLEVGSTSESVTVTGSEINMNTTDGSVSTVVDRQFVANLPLNGRSFQDLILLTPGVVTQTPNASSSPSLGNNGDFSVNGQRTESNSYIVDGVSANTNAGYGNYGASAGGNVPGATALGTTQSLVSVDALQEFRVNSSTYSAEYGRTPGGQFSFVTRSGTDTYHGSAFEYLRNNYFDANNWFTDYYGTKAPALRQNDFGGTFGGPIRIPLLYNGEHKSFFFASYEGLRLTQPQSASVQYVPSTSLRTQAPSGLQPILNTFPLPTPGGVDYGTGLAQFIESYSLPSQIDSTSVRFDHAISSNVRLFFRFSDTPSSAAARSLAVYEPTTSGSQTYTLGATAQLNGSMSNEFRLGLTNSTGSEKFTLDNFGGAQPINLAQALGSTSSPNATSEVILYFGGNVTANELEPSSAQLRQWNLTDAFSWAVGHHVVKLGVDYRYVKSSIYQGTPGVEYEYTTESQVLNDAALLAEAWVITPKIVPTYREFSAFVQDEWHLVPRLTLSLGLRWDVNPPPGAAVGILPYTLEGNFSDPSSLSLAPQDTPLWKTTWYNLAPRLGAAWIAHDKPGCQTVFRAGGGVFFDTGNERASAGYAGPGSYTYQADYGAPAPFPGGIHLTPSAAPPYTSTVGYGYYPHFQLPYTLEWSAAIEQGLGQAQALTISYVAANGRRLLQENELSIHSLNPNFGTILEFTNGPTSNYQSLQTKFQRSVGHGIQALASYTWSHAIDYESNAFTIPLQRGNSDFDVRNNFTAGATWDSPRLSYGHFMNALLNTWAVDGHVIARSGFPVNITGNDAIDTATGAIYYKGVDYDPSKPLYVYGPQYPGGRAINGGVNNTVDPAFTLPTGTALGNAPRNFVRGFGATQVNLAVRREFHANERFNLQFRAESFNVLNHPAFGTVNSTLTNSMFGRATATLNQSLATTSSLYQMGGPRSMQFALKLQF
jgi:hypothetical protein